MKINELHPDIERYLLNDCYCQHEVYSIDGFYYQLFYEHQECEKIGEIHNEGSDLVACVAFPSNDEKKKPQVVLFFLKGDHCYDATRYDATENNIEITKIICTNGTQALKAAGRKFDEFEPGSMSKSLREILSMADAVMIDGGGNR